MGRKEIGWLLKKIKTSKDFYDERDLRRSHVD